MADRQLTSTPGGEPKLRTISNAVYRNVIIGIVILVIAAAVGITYWVCSGQSKPKDPVGTVLDSKRTEFSGNDKVDINSDARKPALSEFDQQILNTPLGRCQDVFAHNPVLKNYTKERNGKCFWRDMRAKTEYDYRYANTVDSSAGNHYLGPKQVGATKMRKGVHGFQIGSLVAQMEARQNTPHILKTIMNKEDEPSADGKQPPVSAKPAK